MELGLQGASGCENLQQWTRAANRCHELMSDYLEYAKGGWNHDKKLTLIQFKARTHEFLKRHGKNIWPRPINARGGLQPNAANMNEEKDR